MALERSRGYVLVTRGCEGNVSNWLAAGAVSVCRVVLCCVVLCCGSPGFVQAVCIMLNCSAWGGGGRSFAG
jgi:hypothetical protein